jgi:hypothetical protein
MEDMGPGFLIFILLLIGFVAAGQLLAWFGRHIGVVIWVTIVVGAIVWLYGRGHQYYLDWQTKRRLEAERRRRLQEEQARQDRATDRLRTAYEDTVRHIDRIINE